MTFPLKKLLKSKETNLLVFSRNIEKKNLPSKDLVSTLVGNLLGHGWGEKRGNTCRFNLHVSVKNQSYLQSLQKFFVKEGYLSNRLLTRSKTIGPKGEIYWTLRMRTFSKANIVWLYDLFFIKTKKLSPKGYPVYNKVVPGSIEKLLTPLALAVWFCGGGSVTGSGCKISTNSFSLIEVEMLKNAIFNRYGFSPTIKKKENKSFLLYIKKEYLPVFSKIVKPHMVSSMFYKLNKF